MDYASPIGEVLAALLEQLKDTASNDSDGRLVDGPYFTSAGLPTLPQFDIGCAEA
jgi:hypothetical protein